MKRLVLLSALFSLGFFSVLEAQENTKTRDFFFASSEFQPTTKRDRFCLPLEERLGKVTNVTVSESNSKSVINVVPDVDSNCVNLTVVVPPAKQACTETPIVSGFTIRSEKTCVTIPSTLTFGVNYTTLPAPEKPKDDNSTPAPR